MLLHSPLARKLPVWHQLDLVLLHSCPSFAPFLGSCSFVWVHCGDVLGSSPLSAWSFRHLVSEPFVLLQLRNTLPSSSAPLIFCILLPVSLSLGMLGHFLVEVPVKYQTMHSVIKSYACLLPSRLLWQKCGKCKSCTLEWTVKWNLELCTHSKVEDPMKSEIIVQMQSNICTPYIHTLESRYEAVTSYTFSWSSNLL